MYKLIAIDIDDTLINKDNEITQPVIDAINKARKNGVTVVLCTGRTLKGAERFYKQLELDTLFITAGGAEIYDADFNRTFENEVDPKLVKELIKYAFDNDIHPQVYIDGELAYRDSNKYSDMYEASYGHPGLVIPDLLEMDEIKTPKVLYVLDADRADYVQAEASDMFPSLAVKRSKPVYIEFCSPTISKAVALKSVAEYYNVDMADVIAVGDSQIDASMIEAAGLGVAMDNAPEELKKIADAVCPSNEQDGVAYVIEKYLLEAQDES